MNKPSVFLVVLLSGAGFFNTVQAEEAVPLVVEEVSVQEALKRAIEEKEQFSKMLDKYYEIRDWDQNGIPVKMKDDII